jgi:gamma-glutamylcyclotransferase (GGCT)/AIG2-like uncharacterized protein YtfP
MTLRQQERDLDRVFAAAADEFLLFVYGTLMRDGPRFSVLAGQRFLGEARTQPGYELHDLGPYPGMITNPGEFVVHGEIFSVANSIRGILDQVEGAPDLYLLEQVHIEGVISPVFSYLYRGKVGAASLIENGRWDNRKAAPWDGGPP